MTLTLNNTNTLTADNIVVGALTLLTYILHKTI